MRILGTKPSSVIVSKMYLQKWKDLFQTCQSKLNKNGIQPLLNRSYIGIFCCYQITRDSQQRLTDGWTTRFDITTLESAALEGYKKVYLIKYFYLIEDKECLVLYNHLALYVVVLDKNFQQRTE